MPDATGRLGAKRWENVRDRIVDNSMDRLQLLVAEYMANGWPPFTDHLSPYQQFQKLLAMRGAGDPNFWGNVQAQAMLAKLEQEFGQAPPISGPGYQPAGIPASTFRVLGATQQSQQLGPPQLGSAA